MSLKDPDNSDLYCITFRPDGGAVAVGGRDQLIKIYDETTKSLVTTLKKEVPVAAGHSNRVFSLRFTEDPNILVSCGWDNTLYFWDVRENKNIGWIIGPHMTGDAMDICGDTLLTGSYSNKDVL